MLVQEVLSVLFQGVPGSNLGGDNCKIWFSSALSKIYERYLKKKFVSTHTISNLMLSGMTIGTFELLEESRWEYIHIITNKTINIIQKRKIISIIDVL
jgi:hypothetical protein